MKIALLILNWFFVVIFGLFTLSMFLMGGRLQVIPLLLVVLILLPPMRDLIHTQMEKPLSPWLYGIAVVVLLFTFSWLGKLNPMTSIYKSPDIEARFMEMYDEKLAQWPVPYEDVFVETTWGKIHAIVSGPEDAPPLYLFHASGVGGWSWLYNVEELSQHYRTYAFDTLGDAGKSDLYDITHYPDNGEKQAKLFVEISDKLGIEQAYVVGASEGGFIGTNFALYAPERVKKLVLLGPMGYAGATQAIIKIMLVQFFPLHPVQRAATQWALGESEFVTVQCGEWFDLMMAGLMPKKAGPFPFSVEQHQQLRVPILLVLGERDALVGDPERAQRGVQDIDGIQVDVIDTGHLLNVEDPKAVNALVLQFLEQ